MKKKVFALMLAAVITLSMSTFAWAVDSDEPRRPAAIKIADTTIVVNK